MYMRKRRRAEPAVARGVGGEAAPKDTHEHEEEEEEWRKNAPAIHSVHAAAEACSEEEGSPQALA